MLDLLEQIKNALTAKRRSQEESVAMLVRRVVRGDKIDPAAIAQSLLDSNMTAEEFAARVERVRQRNEALAAYNMRPEAERRKAAAQAKIDAELAEFERQRLAMESKLAPLRAEVKAADATITQSYAAESVLVETASAEALAANQETRSRYNAITSAITETRKQIELADDVLSSERYRDADKAATAKRREGYVKQLPELERERKLAEVAHIEAQRLFFMA